MATAPPPEPSISSSASPASPRDERRTVTVLFADVSGFAALSERLDPEDVRAFQNDLLPALAGIIRRYDGFVDKYIGDAVFAVFGAPLAHEDDPERAIRCALAMRDEMAAISQTWSGRAGRPLTIHVGVNTGPVVVGQIRDGQPAGEGTYTVTGDTVNTGARLQSAAQAGQIIVGPLTRRLTEHAFRFRPLDPLRLKNKRDPFQAYELLGARSDPQPGHSFNSREGAVVPMVGRDAEIEILRQSVSSLAASSGGVVGLWGEAGLGKSRLVAELHGYARALLPSTATWLEGRSLSYASSIAYQSFADLIRRDAGIAQDDEATALAHLEARVTALFGDEASDLLPYIASLLSLPLPDHLQEPVRRLDGEAMRRQLFRTVRRYIRQLMARAPLILVFEDLHWADEASGDLIIHLLPLVSEGPLLICAASRPDPGTPAARVRDAARTLGQRYQDIRLNPLSPSESGILLDQYISPDGLPDSVRRQLLDRTDGNPFFMEETIRALTDLGGLERDPRTGRWRGTEDLRSIAIPDTVQGVIMARVDRLAPDAKRVLCLASVLGRSFQPGLLRALVDPADPLSNGIDRVLLDLQSLELVRERPQANRPLAESHPDPEYAFTHALVQEAVYESLLQRERRDLHARVAASLEAVHADSLDEHFGVLAYHYARAQLWEKAQAYLFRAGDQAGRLAADAEALAHYEHASTAYAQAFGDRWDPTERAVLERKVGEALFRRAEHAPAAERLVRALSLLGVHYPSSPERIRSALAGAAATQALHRLLPSRFVRRRGASGAVPISEIDACLEALGWIDVFLAPDRWVLDAMVLLNLSESADYPPGVCRGASSVGIVCDFVPLFGLARQYHLLAVAKAGETRDPSMLAQASLGLGIHESFVARWDLARPLFGDAAAAYARASGLREAGTALHLATWARLMLGDDLSACAETFQENVRTGTDAGDDQLRGFGLHGRGLTLMRLGQLPEAESALRAAVQAYRAVPDYGSLVSSLSHLGQCLLMQGAPDAARAAIRESLSVSSTRGLRGSWLSDALNGQAELALHDLSSAPANRQLAAVARRACDEAVQQAKRYRPGLPQALRLRGAYHFLSGHKEASRRSWEASAAAAAHAHMPFEAEEARLALSRSGG